MFQGAFKGTGPEAKIAGRPSCCNPSLCILGGIRNLNEEPILWRLLPLVYTKEKGEYINRSAHILWQVKNGLPESLTLPHCWPARTLLTKEVNIFFIGKKAKFPGQVLMHFHGCHLPFPQDNPSGAVLGNVEGRRYFLAVRRRESKLVCSRSRIRDLLQ